MNIDGERHIGGNTAQSFNHITCTNRAVNIQWFGASGVRDHKENARQTRDMVGVHMREANSSQLPKAPAARFPRYLRPLATIEQRQRRTATHQDAGTVE